MKKINIEVVDPYQEYFKFNKVYCEHNGVKIQSLVDSIQDVLNYKDKLGKSVVKCILAINSGVATLSDDEFKNINSDYIKQIIMVEELENN